MTMSHSFKKTLLASVISIAAFQVNAAGFQLNAQSATGLGRAFSGDAVIADNASVMARNPAAMALFDRTALSLGANMISTEVAVSDAYYTTGIGQGGTVSSNYDNAGGTSVVPNIHAIFPINEQFAVGVNVYSNFGTKTEFDSSFVGAEYGGLTDVKSVNMGLAASYRINQQWSIGAGLDFIYGSGDLKRTFSDELPLLDAEATGFGVGFNLGTVFELNENNRFGLAYHYSPEIKADGDISLGGGLATSDTLYLPLPDMIEFSGYHHINDTPYAVHYSVQWIGWSAFDTLDIEGTGGRTVISSPYEWRDAMHFSLGGTYYLNNSWTLRGGYMYDQSAQDKLTSVSVPDSDRQWFSAGFTYHMNQDANIDFGMTYLVGQDISVEERNDPISSITGTTRADAILVAVQYSHLF